MPLFIIIDAEKPNPGDIIDVDVTFDHLHWFCSQAGVEVEDLKERYCGIGRMYEMGTDKKYHRYYIDPNYDCEDNFLLYLADYDCLGIGPNEHFQNLCIATKTTPAPGIGRVFVQDGVGTGAIKITDTEWLLEHIYLLSGEAKQCGFLETKELPLQ